VECFRSRSWAAEFLASACPGDAELREEVRSLLAQNADSFLESAPVWALDAALSETRTKLSAGAKLGPYEILDSLGEGGMGMVYRALDTRLGRQVAIKISARRFSGRFDREAKAISALNHPRICTLYDVGPNYLVMELVEGETLAALLRHGPLLRERVCNTRLKSRRD